MYPDVLSEDDMRFYISHNPDINPHMHNWNTVLVRYCDGSSFAGNAEHLHKVTVHSCCDWLVMLLLSYTLLPTLN
jgi:hypothetical protein